MGHLVIELDHGPVQRQGFTLSHSGVQQQPDGGKAEHAFRLLLDDFDQRSVKLFEFGGLEKVLYLARWPRRDGDAVRVAESARCAKAHQAFEQYQRIRPSTEVRDGVEPALRSRRVEGGGGLVLDPGEMLAPSVAVRLDRRLTFNADGIQQRIT